jgi:hypothetical protein
MPELREQLESALGTTYVLERELGGGGMSRVFGVDLWKNADPNCSRSWARFVGDSRDR